MTPFRRLAYSRPLLWALLAMPAAWIAAGYARDELFYGEVVHITGDVAVWLLIVTMAVSPMAMLFPRAPWTRWLLRRRRALGVASFGYALFHTAVYVARKQGLAVSEAFQPGLLAGWVAMTVMLALAVTSNDVSVRRLRAAWKRLHKLVYLAAVLTFGHWLLEAYDPVPALIQGGLLLGLVLLRLVLAHRHDSRSQ